MHPFHFSFHSGTGVPTVQTNLTNFESFVPFLAEAGIEKSSTFLVTLEGRLWGRN